MALRICENLEKKEKKKTLCYVRFTYREQRHVYIFVINTLGVWALSLLITAKINSRNNSLLFSTRSLASVKAFSPCLCTAMMMQRADFPVSLTQLINQAGLADILPTSPASSYHHGDHAAAIAATVPLETRDHCTFCLNNSVQQADEAIYDGTAVVNVYFVCRRCCYNGV